MDSHANFAYGTVATAPSPATSGTALVLAANFPTPPTPPFNVTIWPASVQPTASNAEIARVTANSAGTLTITRAQEGTSARTVVVGDQVAVTITAKTLTDIEGAVGGGGAPDLDVLGFNYYGSMTADAGSPVTIPVSQALIPWDTSSSSNYPGQAAPFFTLTDPTRPVVVEDGIYEVIAEATYLGGSFPKAWRLFVFFDLDGIFDGPGVGGTMEYDEGDGVTPQLCTAGTRKLLAGSKVGVRIAQYSGAPANFNTWIQVQRIA